jgi:hypothetical protein
MRAETGMRQLGDDTGADASVQLASVGSGVAVVMQTQYGLGRNMEVLSEEQIVAYQKVCMFAYGRVSSLPSCMMTIKLRLAPVLFGKTWLMLAGRICEQAALHRHPCPG